MSVVAPHECWEPGLDPRKVRLLDDDGEQARLFGPGQAEVALIGPRRPDGSSFVLPFAFETLEQAKRAGKILSVALGGLQRIADEVIDQDSCRHDFDLTRFTRALPKTAICGKCSLAIDLPAIGRDGPAQPERAGGCGGTRGAS